MNPRERKLWELRRRLAQSRKANQVPGLPSLQALAMPSCNLAPHELPCRQPLLLLLGHSAVAPSRQQEGCDASNACCDRTQSNDWQHGTAGTLATALVSA